MFCIKRICQTNDGTVLIRWVVYLLSLNIFNLLTSHLLSFDVQQVLVNNQKALLQWQCRVSHHSSHLKPVQPNPNLLLLIHLVLVYSPEIDKSDYDFIVSASDYDGILPESEGYKTVPVIVTIISSEAATSESK